MWGELVSYALTILQQTIGFSVTGEPARMPLGVSLRLGAMGCLQANHSRGAGWLARYRNRAKLIIIAMIGNAYMFSIVGRI
jgi:hypothetical protein